MKKILASVLLPPLSTVILTLIGILLLRKSRKFGVALIGFSAITTIALASTVVGSTLLATLQSFPVFDAARPTDAQAIVVLAGGLRKGALEYGGRDELNIATLERLRYGAWLARKTRLPILVTGGSRYGRGPSEAEVMDRALREEYGLSARWVESDSKDTEDNARYSRRVLDEAGISRVLLVTHAWHMRRALHEFQTAGLEPVAAATAYVGTDVVSWQSYLPNVKSYLDSTWALHEWLGMLWSRLKGD